jgi:hypothetical protein
MLMWRPLARGGEIPNSFIRIQKRRRLTSLAYRGSTQPYGIQTSEQLSEGAPCSACKSFAVLLCCCIYFLLYRVRNSFPALLTLYVKAWMPVIARPRMRV